MFDKKKKNIKIEPIFEDSENKQRIAVVVEKMQVVASSIGCPPSRIDKLTGNVMW